MPEQKEHRPRDEAMPGTLQEMLLALLIFGASGGSVVAGIARAEHFDGVYREVAAAALDYRARYGKAPGRAHIEDLLAVRQPRGGSARVSRIIRQLEARAGEVHPDYAAQRAREHVRRAAIKTALVEAGERYSGPPEGAVEDMEAVLYAALRARADEGDAGTFLSDTAKGLAFLDRTESGPFYALGIPVLDRMRVGMTPGEIILYIAAKGSGKCVVEGEPVVLSDGNYVSIENVPDGAMVPSLDGDVFIPRSARLVFNGVKPSFRVLLHSGREIRITKNHRLLTEAGWLPLSRLSVGDTVACPATLPVFGVGISNLETMRVLGYLIADGGLTKTRGSPTFSKTDPLIIQDMRRCLRIFGGRLVPDRSGVSFWVVGGGKGFENRVCTLLRESGLLGKKSNRKFIPEWVLKLRKEYVAEFLNALFSCDGSVYTCGNAHGFEYSSTSYVLARQVDHLLTRFGIRTMLRHRILTVNGQPYKSWSIVVSQRGQLRLLADEIGLTSIKGRKLDAILALPYNRKLNTRKLTTGGSIFFDRIKSIEPIGDMRTYDLAVDQSHNFVAGNVLVHNSWFCIQCGRQAVVQGARVVHVTLEMDEDRVAQRYYQTFLGIASRRDKYPMTTLELDELERLLPPSKPRMVSPRAAFADPRIREWIRGKIKPWGTRLGRMVIKRFPTGQLTVEGLRGYLDYLEHAHKFVPSVVIVDYPDLMRLPARDYRIEIGRIYVALRGLAVDRNVAMVLPTQGNRSSLDASTVRGGMVSEDKTKLDTADVVLTYSQTRPERKRGLARLGLEYSRNSDRGHVIVMTQSYPTGQYVVQSALQSGAYWDAVKSGGDEEDGE